MSEPFSSLIKIIQVVSASSENLSSGDTTYPPGSNELPLLNRRLCQVA